jgi:TetR/AcrR family transcriptional regulator
MSKSREAPHLDVRKETLAAARRLFAERGFEGTAVQDVASAVGVSKQAVLHYFASKADLREAVLSELMAHWATVLPRLLLEASGGYRRFTAVFGTLVRFFNEEPSWSKLVVREWLDRPDETRAMLQMTVRPWIGAIADTVRLGQAEGLIREEVDAEAWVVEMLQFGLFSAAAHPVLAGALEGQGARRLDEELNRIASSSLFKDRPLPSKKRG